MALPDFGTDVSTVGDLDPTFTPVSGQRVVLERILRRLSTARGTLAYAPDEGIDIGDWTNDATTRMQRLVLANYIRSEVERDEAVTSTDVSVSLEANGLVALISVETDDGPFSLTIPIADVSAARLHT
ncbi:hypothetical protein LZC95_50230 [Pendulispora brunnea]|uniref:Uncharacterized protein n=1 Tax=Pendulispora brunnea TaxID=2905690 RepID=A0ABZ2KCH0_9BACT